MIVRIWHGAVKTHKADEYAEFLKQRAAPDYSSVQGLQRLYFLRNNDGGVEHFLLMTVWDSMDSVKKFAGDNPEIAKYYPEDDEFLLEREERVSFYELFYEE